MKGPKIESADFVHAVAYCCMLLLCGAEGRRLRKKGHNQLRVEPRDQNYAQRRFNQCSIKEFNPITFASKPRGKQV